MQVKEKTPFDAHVGTPFGATPERRTGWMWALIVLLGVAVLALGAALVYPAVTTTDGEEVMNRFDDAWNSGEVTAFPDIYASNATIVLSDGQTYSGLGEIEATAGAAQGQGFRIERTGTVTESDNLIAYPATVTIGGDTGDAMIVLRYDDAGMVLEQQVIWQTP